MIPYARQTIADADIAAVVKVLRSDFLTQGPVVPRFEDAVAAFSGARYAVATANATAALHVAVRALGVGPGSLVWTSPNSFVASANCARYCDARVDFVDIDPQTYNMSVTALEQKLAHAERAGRVPDVIVLVDFAGQPCDLEPISRLRDRYGFRIIEDASHAIGATYRGERVGSGRHADITVFSFHPVKIITTAEGGIALTNDAKLAERMRLSRSHGVTREPHIMHNGDPQPWEYEQIDLGFNYRLTELQAALGTAQLERIDTFLQRRREIAARYDRELAALPLQLPYKASGCESALHLYPVQVRDDAPLDRRGLYDALRVRGVAPNVHYIPIHTHPYYRSLGFKAGDFPQAERYYARALSLPMYVSLTDEEQGQVIAALRESLNA
jgi:UDP-4-amino-4,6-dideoxy-N-acetyl-beta-L-altrosamine transaminase